MLKYSIPIMSCNLPRYQASLLNGFWSTHFLYNEHDDFCLRYMVDRVNHELTVFKGPFTLVIFAVISSAISNCLCKLLAIQITTESPVVYMGDLKSSRNCHEIAAKIAAKIASVNGPLSCISCREPFRSDAWILSRLTSSVWNFLAWITDASLGEPQEALMWGGCILQVSRCMVLFLFYCCHHSAPSQEEWNSWTDLIKLVQSKTNATVACKLPLEPGAVDDVVNKIRLIQTIGCQVSNLNLFGYKYMVPKIHLNAYEDLL